MTSCQMRWAAIAAAAGAALLPSAGSAQSIGLQDSFRIGTSGTAVCTAQSMAAGDALTDMFDRGWSIVCRDAAVPVGQIYALRTRAGDPAERLAALRGDRTACEAAGEETVEDLGTVAAYRCTLTDTDVGYRVYMKRDGGVLYVAEGFAGYDSALRVGLRTVVADRPVEGEVSVATTGAGDPAAFARVQAGSLDPQRALAEAYRRNNAGAYAESAEFFASLTDGDASAESQAEALVNEALQKSNLGDYGQADALFARAEELAGGDPVTARRLRNYRAMHLLNRGRTDEALAELNRPLPQGTALRSSSIEELVIDAATAARLSAEGRGGNIGGAQGLLPEDKARILDAQAQHLRGTVHRLQDRPDAAAQALEQALAELSSVRGGRIAATIWMRAQILGELADIAEQRRDPTAAERRHEEAVALLSTEYPGSSALLSAKGRLAGYYARTGRTPAAIALYREIVSANAEAGNSSPTLRRVLSPYFRLLTRAGGEESAADLFAASQILVRPGVAQTQAVLARELSGGSDEASRLFRQSVTLTRDIERTRVELARLEAAAEPSPADLSRIEELRTALERLERDQVSTQARLADFPRYRAVSSGVIGLADMQALLREGEAYYKMTVVGDNAYAVLVTPRTARAWRIDAGTTELERDVDALRATISTVENGQLVTYPFDVELAHRMYRTLFGPVSAELAGVRHLVFEPDGAMLRLPPNLLVMDEAGVQAYRARAADPASDGFDFTGIEWLGRDRDISTAVSARAFRDVRQAPPSRAEAEYIGFGQNAPAQSFFLPAAASATRGAADGQGDCGWSLAAWNRPISAQELYTASQAIAPDRPTETDIVTGEEFTDTAILRRDDLDTYRIMHFATHGLVTPPRPECPARPALMTSFGAGQSDGLLSFREIFDLRLDADLIILSACDTAGRASLAATREAGITTGGDFAFDGLVRAFVGAGGRLVLASHWPVPDDFDATQRLISGLFTQPAGTSTATALRTAQQALMDEAATSHPYYWSGFAVVGDGTAPVIRREGERIARAD